MVQIPAGVLFVYPSALFLHFNVKMDFELVVTSGGEYPTPDNSVPLSDDPSGSRCSMVWFTQASVIQSALLPFVSVKETVQMEEEKQKSNPKDSSYYVSTFDAADALARGFFPLGEPYSDGQRSGSGPRI